MTEPKCRDYNLQEELEHRRAYLDQLYGKDSKPTDHYEGKKRCIQCGRLLPESCFYKTSKRRGTLRGHCRSCQSLRAKQSYRKHKESRKQSNRQRYREWYHRQRQPKGQGRRGEFDRDPTRS